MTSFDTKIGNLVEKMYQKHAAAIRKEYVAAISKVLETKQSMDEERVSITNKYAEPIKGLEDFIDAFQNFLRKAEKQKLGKKDKLKRSSPLLKKLTETHVSMIFGEDTKLDFNIVKARIMERIEEPQKRLDKLTVKRREELKMAQARIEGGAHYKRVGDIVGNLKLGERGTKDQAIGIFESFEKGETTKYSSKVHNLRFFLEKLGHWGLFKVRQQLKYELCNLDKATSDGVDKIVVVKTKKNMKMMKKYAGKKTALGKMYRVEARKKDDKFAQLVTELFLEVEAIVD